MFATDSHPAASEGLDWRQLATGQKTLGCLPPGGALVCRAGLLAGWGCGGGGGGDIVAVAIGSAAVLLVGAAATPPSLAKPSPVLRLPAWRKAPCKPAEAAVVEAADLGRFGFITPNV